MAGYWPSFFFMDLDFVSVHKHAKKDEAKERTSLVNKGFIRWLSGKCLVRDAVGSPARAR